MEIMQTKFQDALLIKPKVYFDQRGWFMESYNAQKYHFNGITFVQDNHSCSLLKGTLRGLHFQNDPKGQTKLVRCIKGKIWDVIVDLRMGSPTYLKWEGYELSDYNKLQLLIPKGFAHGFVTLEDDCEVVYKVDEFYSLSHDRCIIYNDPDIGIIWPLDDLVLSEKDANASLFKSCDVNFTFSKEVSK